MSTDAVMPNASVARLQERLKAAERPAILVGPGVLRRADRDAVLHQVWRLSQRELTRVPRLRLWRKVGAHQPLIQSGLRHGLCPAVGLPSGMHEEGITR